MSDVETPTYPSKTEVLENGPLSVWNPLGFEGKGLRV